MRPQRLPAPARPDVPRASGIRAGGLFPCPLLAVLTLGCIVSCSPPRPAEPDRPNVLLISVDTLRADRLGSYGARAVETPAIDRLAAEGVRFEHAFSPVPLTLPAHWTMHTGVEPWHHGVVDNGMVMGTPPGATLAERFSAAGYDTAAFVSAFVLHRSFGLDRGFARYDDGPAADAALDQLFHATAPADERVGRSLAWLRRPRERPFFLWLHLFDPHAPYEPPQAFQALFAGRPYDGEIAFVDTQVARLLAGLDAAGIARKTLVVLTSDHGESLGEHGEATHGVLLYDATLRVPLFFRQPGTLPAGEVRDQAVGLADIAPTVLALAGLDRGNDLDGVDLFSGEVTPPRTLAAISDSPRRRLGWSSLVAVRKGAWKYILAPRSELYRVADDPGELADRLQSDPQAAVELERAARRVAAAVVERRADRTATDPGAEEKARLAALGYITTSRERQNGGADPTEAIALLSELDRAHQLLAEGRLDAAEQALRGMLGSGTLPLAALESLGRIARLRGRPAEAEAYFERLLEFEPESPTALAQLVQLARERGDVERAVTVGRQLARLAPRDGSASRLLAEALAAAGDAAASEAEWRRGLAVAPRAHWLRFGYARFLIAADRGEEAAAELDRIVADEEAPEGVVEQAQAARARLSPSS